MPKVKTAFFILHTLLVLFIFSCNTAFSSDSNAQEGTNQTGKEAPTAKETREDKNKMTNNPTFEDQKKDEKKKKKKNLLDESFTKDIF